MKGAEMRKAGMSRLGTLAVSATALLLAGCVSLGGGDPPDRLLTLTPATAAAVGEAGEGELSQALAVSVPAAAQKLDVTRVPVQVNASSIAYLQDAVWVEKPARLFAGLLAETIRAGGDRLVVGGSDLGYAAATHLGGELVDMGYDARSGDVIVRYDAMLQLPDGRVLTRRFESSVGGLPADAAFVGPALNDAANAVAGEVAEWVEQTLG